MINGFFKGFCATRFQCIDNFGFEGRIALDAIGVLITAVGGFTLKGNATHIIAVGRSVLSFNP